MAPPRMRHGVVVPANKAGAVPARIVNVRSRRSTGNNSRLRLDKLLRSTRPVVCIKRRLGGIGDVLMTTPLLKSIKQLIPHCHLIYATDLVYSEGALGDIIRHNPYVDELIPNTEIREADYDYSVDVTTTGLDRERAGKIPPNRIDMFAEEAGIDVSADPIPVYIIKEEERLKAQEELKGITGGDANMQIVAIQVRSNDARRTWPLERMAQLAHSLAEESNIKVLLFDWGSSVPQWSRTHENMWLMMDRSFVDTAALVEQCDLVVCPDSSMLHIAGALNKKIVAIFGPIPPESRINYYANAVPVTNTLLCKNCWYNPKCIRDEDHKLECLTGITVDKVKAAVIKKLGEPLMPQKNITYGQNMTLKGQDPIILVRRTTSGIGDLLMTTPGIDALKTRFPDKEIHVSCPPETIPALENNPSITKIIDCNQGINYKRYFMVIDVSSPCASYEAARITSNRPVQKSRVEIFAEAMDIRETITSLKPRYHVTEEERVWAQDFLAKTMPTSKPRIAVGLRSIELYRNWPERYYGMLFDLLKPHVEPIILDHSREQLYEGVVDACGFPLRKAIAIMSECDGLITVDTSLLHFGAALNLPTIALFGPIDYKSRCKGYNNVTVVTASLPCSPCWRNARMPCKQTGFVKAYSKCLEVIQPQRVVDIAIKKFKGDK